jgi:glycosyltransferase involved in cell wall biosynthesis
MVTRNRSHLARRAVHCFAKQTWTNKELVVIDDGTEDYEPILEPYRARCLIHYHRVPEQPGHHLGALRNQSLSRANGDLCAQWDDDEWYHPDRLTVQMRALDRQNLDAVLLRWTLMHMDTEPFVEHPFRGQVRKGTPGTILHRRTDVQYRNAPRREDSWFRGALARAGRLGLVEQPHSHLFIRCFHGANTWDVRHFTRRLRQTLPDKIRYLRARFLARDLLSHPLFRLTDLERASFTQFVRDSHALGILKP